MELAFFKISCLQDKLKLHFGHVFEQTIATPEQMQNIREDFEVETPSDNVQELTENEKLIMVDMVKMQSVLSGDDTISIRDELFEYLKSAERGIDYERFCDLLKITIRSIPDDPTSSKIMGMVIDLLTCFMYQLYQKCVINLTCWCRI